MADVDHRIRGARYRARRRAASLLYEADVRGAEPVSLAEERRELGRTAAEYPEIAPYTMDIVRGATEHRERIDAVISDHLQGWTLDRLAAVDRAILRGATWELLHGPDDAPAAVVIDQSVLLTADLSGERSVPFVNAVLDGAAGLAAHIRAAEAVVAGLDSGSGGSEPPAEEPRRSDD